MRKGRVPPGGAGRPFLLRLEYAGSAIVSVMGRQAGNDKNINEPSGHVFTRGVLWENNCATKLIVPGCQCYRFLSRFHWLKLIVSYHFFVFFFAHWKMCNFSNPSIKNGKVHSLVTTWEFFSRLW